MVDVLTPPAGWYPDPEVVGRERWWNGEDWTDASHKPPADWDWAPEWTRAMWPAANAPARVLSRLGWLIVLAVPGVALAFVSKPLSIAVLTLAVAIQLACVVLGIAALRRAGTQGGLGIAVWALVAPTCFAVGTLAALFVILVLTPFRA